MQMSHDSQAGTTTLLQRDYEWLPPKPGDRSLLSLTHSFWSSLEPGHTQAQYPPFRPISRCLHTLHKDDQIEGRIAVSQLNEALLTQSYCTYSVGTLRMKPYQQNTTAKLSKYVWITYPKLFATLTLTRIQLIREIQGDSFVGPIWFAKNFARRPPPQHISK